MLVYETSIKNSLLYAELELELGEFNLLWIGKAHHERLTEIYAPVGPAVLVW
jgi:hypothetical protein